MEEQWYLQSEWLPRIALALEDIARIMANATQYPAPLQVDEAAKQREARQQQMEREMFGKVELEPEPDNIPF